MHTIGARWGPPIFSGSAVIAGGGGGNDTARAICTIQSATSTPDAGQRCTDSVAASGGVHAAQAAASRSSSAGASTTGNAASGTSATQVTRRSRPSNSSAIACANSDAHVPSAASANPAPDGSAGKRASAPRAMPGSEDSAGSTSSTRSVDTAKPRPLTSTTEERLSCRSTSVGAETVMRRQRGGQERQRCIGWRCPPVATGTPATEPAMPPAPRIVRALLAPA